MDMAVTSGLQCGLLGISEADGSCAAERYAERKRQHLQTAQLCDDACITFAPFIVEAEGGWVRWRAAS